MNAPTTAFRKLRSLTPRPVRRVVGAAYAGTLASLPMRAKVKLLYWKSYQRFPDLRRPVLFSEKAQAFKLDPPHVGPFIDKVLAKRFAAERIGAEHVIPTLYSGAALPPVAERRWPLPYVIKTNNGSGGNIFVRREPDWPEIEERIARFLDHDFASVSGESFYAQAEPKVLVEPFVSDSDALPVDYKFYTFDGRVEFIQVDTDREHGHKRVIFDTEWNRLPISYGRPVDPRPIPAPDCLAEMVRLASALSRGFSFVRVDLYAIGGRVFFGELTFTPDSGLMKFDPISLDRTLGEKWRWPSVVPAFRA